MCARADAILFFPRIDYTLLPGPTSELYVWDSGFTAYVALLRMDHRYNNPARVVFTDLLIERLQHVRSARRQAQALARVKAAQLHLRAGTRMGVAQRSSIVGWFTRATKVPSVAPPSPAVTMFDETVRDGFNPRYAWRLGLEFAKYVAYEREQAKVRRVRNRWRKARLLFFNQPLRRPLADG